MVTRTRENHASNFAQSTVILSLPKNLVLMKSLVVIGEILRIRLRMTRRFG